MKEKIRLAYIDEEESWNSIAYSQLKNDFELYIPKSLSQNLEELWSELNDWGTQAVLVDYRLNESGIVSYTGDDVIREFHKHNRHLPMFIITSFEDNALIECKDAQIIRGKELFTHSDQFIKLKNIIIGNVNNYNSRKVYAENVIKSLQEKISQEEIITEEEAAVKFEAELYLSELDLDNSVRSDMITSKSNDTLEEMLKVAQKIVELHKK